MKETKFLPDSNGLVPIVLAVDDQSINLMLLSNQLRLIGLRSEIAENGKTALEKWKNGSFALIITDCHMPEMDGYELAREIRKIESEQNRTPIPIIGWSASDPAEASKLCRAAGMSDVLSKPSTPEQMAKLLVKYINQTPKAPVKNTEKVNLPIDYTIFKKAVPNSAEQNDVLRSFYRHILLDYTELLPLLANKDFTKLGKMAHRMKGSCLMVGASQFAASLAKVEHVADQKELAGINQASVELAQAFGELETYFIQIGIIEKQVEHHKDGISAC
jgi:CheY-like chemotaxis protein